MLPCIFECPFDQRKRPRTQWLVCVTHKSSYRTKSNLGGVKLHLMQVQIRVTGGTYSFSFFPFTFFLSFFFLFFLIHSSIHCTSLHVRGTLEHTILALEHKTEVTCYPCNLFSWSWIQNNNFLFLTPKSCCSCRLMLDLALWVKGIREREWRVRVPVMTFDNLTYRTFQFHTPVTMERIVWIRKKRSSMRRRWRKKKSETTESPLAMGSCVSTHSMIHSEHIFFPFLPPFRPLGTLNQG